MINEGAVIRDYEVGPMLNMGNFAISYKASKSGRPVFFKQYRSPRPSVDWYRSYVSYQDEMRRRIDGSPLKNMSVKIVDFFESTMPPRHSRFSTHYFQVFEWVAKGGSLEEQVVKARSPVAWDKAMIWAKVMMAGVKILHAQKIVHCDLKPENIVLIEDKSIAAGHVLKLIDMDFSILADRQAPWHGIEGYVGTPSYMSPEHLQVQIPVPESDVFTCGIMLSQMLGSGYPYAARDGDELKDMVLNGGFKPVTLRGSPENAALVTSTIEAMLHPDPGQRPAAGEVLDVLNGRVSSMAGGRSVKVEPAMRVEPPSRSIAATGPVAVSVPVSSTPPAAPASSISQLQLEYGTKLVSLNISSNCNQAWAASSLAAGDDKRFWDHTKQFELRKTHTGWSVVPNTAAANETMLNGRAVASETEIQAGDVIGVGREAKGIVKTPITVRSIG